MPSNRETLFGPWVAVLTLALSMPCFEAHTQWQKTNGPEGGEILALATNGAMIAAGSFSGVHLSSDGGATWSPANEGIFGVRITSLLYHGNDLFAGSSGRGVWYRPGGSPSWQTSDGVLANAMISALGTDGTAYFAGRTGAGVYRSSDYGVTWSKADSGMAAGTTVDARRLPNGVYFYRLVTERESLTRKMILAR